MRGRSLFRPKFPEMPAQCASCPFRSDNNVAWRAVLNRLAAASGLPPVTGTRAAQARAQVRDEVAAQGEFQCHQSAYDQHMQMRPLRDRRQCPGATRWYKEQPDGPEVRPPPRVPTAAAPPAPASSTRQEPGPLTRTRPARRAPRPARRGT